MIEIFDVPMEIAICPMCGHELFANARNTETGFYFYTVCKNELCENMNFDSVHDAIREWLSKQE